MDASTLRRPLPGGPAIRPTPAGVEGGAPLTRIHGPQDALGLVAEELKAAEGHLHELVQSDVAAVPAVAGYLNAAGGKRLRPALTAIAARALGVEDLGRLMCVGELIHLGSLLHDDVVDDGLTRRGQATTHRVFGAPVSVLAGDFCLARAMWLAAEDGGHLSVARLGKAVTEMAEGEVLQLQRAFDLSTDVEGYFEVIDRKSAALIAWCAAAPAYATGDTRAAEALERYGRGVGRAFQIVDDILDYSATSGKTLGNDLRDRKVTLPLIYAMDADPALRAELEAGRPADDRIPALVERVVATGGLDRAMADARRVMQEGIDALAALPESVGRQALEVLGRYLVERSV